MPNKLSPVKKLKSKFFDIIEEANKFYPKEFKIESESGVAAYSTVKINNFTHYRTPHSVRIVRLGQ